MIKQNDKRCLPVIQNVGCFVRSCGAMAELKTGKELTAGQINELWTWGKKSGHINLDNMVKHSAPIATHALKILDCSGRFVEVATFKDGKMSYYGSITDEMKALPKFFIQKIKTNGSVGTHFRNVDNAGRVLFDPYYPDVKPEGIFYSVVYVYLET